MEEEAANGFFLLWVSSGMGSCIWVILVIYNLISLIGHMRADHDGETASGLSKAASGQRPPAATNGRRARSTKRSPRLCCV